MLQAVPKDVVLFLFSRGWMDAFRLPAFLKQHAQDEFILKPHQFQGGDFGLQDIVGL